MTSSIPYDWIREIKPEIASLDTVPLTGAVPAFPWEELGVRLAQAFEKGSIRLHPQEPVWRTKEGLYEGLGDVLMPLNFSIPSMRGNACWVMPEQEILNLESLLLTKDIHPISFHDTSLTSAFYRFLALEVLFHMSQIHFDRAIVPILLSQGQLPQEHALCRDVSIALQGHTLWGRLIISSELQRSWVEYFASHGQTSPLAEQLAHMIQVDLHLEVGHVQLSSEALASLRLGDWIVLDAFSLDLTNLTGAVALSVEGKALFQGKLINRGQQIQIN